MASAAPSGVGGGDDKPPETAPGNHTSLDPPADPQRNGEPPASPSAPVKSPGDDDMSPMGKAAIPNLARAEFGLKRPLPSRTLPCRACARRTMILRGIDPGPRSNDELSALPSAPVPVADPEARGTNGSPSATAWCGRCEFRKKIILNRRLRRNSEVPAPPPGRGRKRPLSVEQARGYRECDVGKKLMRHKWDGLYHKWAGLRRDSAPEMAGFGAPAGRHDLLENMMLFGQRGLRVDDAKLAPPHGAQNPSSSAAARIDVLLEKLAQMNKVLKVSMKLLQVLCPYVGSSAEAGGGVDGNDWRLVEEAIDNLVNQTGEGMQDIVKTVIPKVFSKDILYDLIMACVGRYPKYLEDDKGKLSTEQYEQYQKQLDLLVNLTLVYDNDPENFPKIMKLMCKIGGCGPLPSQVIDDISPGLDPSTMKQLDRIGVQLPAKGEARCLYTSPPGAPDSELGGIEETGGVKRKRQLEEAGESKRKRDEQLNAQTWSELPDDIMVSLFLIVPGKYNRQRMALTCRTWREAYTRFCILFPFMTPKELPWLFMPSSTQSLTHATLEAMTHRCSLAQEITGDARFCGSSEGGLAVVALDNTRTHMLYSFKSRKTSPLPSSLVFIDSQVKEIRVEAAVPLGWPGQDTVCIVAAIVRDVNKAEPSEMAYWQPGLQHWFHLRSAWYSDSRQINVLDVMYHTDLEAFIFLSEDLNVHIFKRAFDENGRFIIDYDKLQVENDWHYVRLVERGGLSHLQYLSQNGADILRISKNLNYDGRTRRLTVFKLEVEFESAASENESDDEEENDDKDDAEEEKRRVVSWSPSCKLPGRVVFAGRASSRIFEVTNSFADHILFHEERPGEDEEHPGEDVELPPPGLFDRSDTGMYSVEVAAVRPWPPAGGEIIVPYSDMCPSAWWFH